VHSVADPFLAYDDDSWHLFFELWNNDSAKGEIGFASSPDGKRWTYQARALLEPFHLSYPYVFPVGRDWYMVPETGAVRCIRLYRATAFPAHWEFVTCLLTEDVLTRPEESFVDSSLIHHGDSWWIFTDTSPAGRCETLRLYMSRELEGPYVEHPLSPLVERDATGARPAGRIVAHREGMVRFSQICQPRYGTGIRAFHIGTLTPTSYEEVPLGRNPLLGATGKGWNGMGMHTIDMHPRADGTWLAAVDGLSSNHLRRLTR
jgi:hypothetical protein